MAVCPLVCVLHYCGCIFMETELPLCVQPVVKATWVLAHTYRWSTERLFMFAEEFAL